MARKTASAPKGLKTRPDEFDLLLCKVNGHQKLNALGVCPRCEGEAR